jgi:hypothetical protein
MSNIGLNTNTFRITGKYLDWLTEFIVKAKVHLQIENSQKEKFVEFLNNISDVNNTEPQFHLLSSIIERELRAKDKNPEIYLTKLKTQLEEEMVDMSEVIPKIQFIVKILDNENSEALAKIKGE